MSGFFKFLFAHFAYDAFKSTLRRWQQQRNPSTEESISPGLPVDNIQDKVHLLESRKSAPTDIPNRLPTNTGIDLSVLEQIQILSEDMKDG